MLNYYLVKLTLILGEYEKATIHIVSALSESEAYLLALRGESHHDDAGYEEGEWWDGDFIYKVHSCSELTPAEYEQALKYT